MALRTGNRNQYTLLPPVIDDYVGKDDPVRAYDTFVEALDLDKLGLKVNTNKVGCPQYCPKAMLKLLIYGYSYGWRSSRKLERAIHHNVSFIWLMGGLKPDHKTISKFRKDNMHALKKVLSQSVRMCMKLGLIEGNTIFLDGTKMRGNASINHTHTKESLTEKLTKIDERIEKLLEEINTIDEKEWNQDSLVKMQKELRSKDKLKDKVREALEIIDREDLANINLTDNECVNVKGRQGTHAGYNAQITVDEKHGLIVTSDVVTQNNDLNQFQNQIGKANSTLGKNCETACADSGYANVSNLKESLKEGINVVVPNQKQALRKSSISTPFDKTSFKYDEANDVYVCPEGNILEYKSRDNKKKAMQYRITKKNTCVECKHFGVCTKSKNGRTIKRLDDEKTKEHLAKYYESDFAQEIYKKRKMKVELPFGHIKRNLKGGQFLICGKDGANAEMSINCSCFNIVRMINLLGGVKSFSTVLLGLKC